MKGGEAGMAPEKQNPLTGRSEGDTTNAKGDKSYEFF